MILFIFEGQREETVYKSMEALFFGSLPEGESIVRIYDGNIYDLYSTYEQYGGDVDIVSLLKDRFAKRGKEIFPRETKVSDFAEIYLFFDFDFHHSKMPIGELCDNVLKMLSVFDNETETGKLYISYPMIEALRYTKQLPDKNFYSYAVTREQSKGFKDLVNSFSDYKNHRFITYKKGYSKDKYDLVKHNWLMLIKQNVEKANWLCSGSLNLPDNIDDITPMKVFVSQHDDYILPHEIVAVLSAFAMFLYDYFGKGIIDSARQSS